jgi:hypothetical protein
MTELKTKEGRVLVYDDTPTGWGIGQLEGTETHVDIRQKAHGGGVFIRHPHSDSPLREAVTGEETVWFNNRLWTKTEEAELVERIKHAE